MTIEGWDWRGDAPTSVDEDEITSGIMVFTPAESKRLIAKAVVSMPVVQNALKKGRVIVAGGITNGYIAEEILGKPVAKEFYTKGNITHGLLCTTGRSDKWIKPYVFVDGVAVDRSMEDVLKEFEADDVFIKGANAVDLDGNAGVLLGSPIGGTMGACMGILSARGSHLIMPVGLEKLVPSVLDASRKCGLKKLKYPVGATVGYYPAVGATVITELEALGILAEVEATHVAGGGVGGSEGAVVLVVEGPDVNVRAAFEIWEKIKGEPPVPVSPITFRYGMDGASGV